MKKLFSVLAIAAVFAACNSSESTEEVKPADSTTVAPADNSSMPPAADSTATTADSTGAAK